MSIPYGHQSISDEDIAEVVEALKSDWLSMGPRVEEFEAAVAREAGSEFAVAVSSGTAALHCAYAAAGVQPGDEVIVTPLTFVATAATAVMRGAKIQFADVQEDTGNIDPHSVESMITNSTRVIAAVDFAGHPADMDELSVLANARNILVLEDAAHSLSSTYRGRSVGSLADLTTFSFFPTKNLTTAEGGAVVARSEAQADAARRFRSHGLIRDRTMQRYPEEGPWHQEVHDLGLNYRLADVLCALGISQFRRLKEFKSARARIFDRYAEGLSDIDGLKLPAKREYVDPMWHLYPLRVKDGRRREVFEFLRSHDVLVQVNYIPAYWHPFFEDLGYQRGMCPVAEAYYQEEISLPMFASLPVADQDRVIDLVRQAIT